MRDYLQSLYVTVLGRPADPGGLEYWLDYEGSILDAFMNSEEVFQIYSGMSDDEQLYRFFDNALGRVPTLDELSIIKYQLVDGDPLVALDSAGVFVARVDAAHTVTEEVQMLGNTFYDVLADFNDSIVAGDYLATGSRSEGDLMELMYDLGFERPVFQPFMLPSEELPFEFDPYAYWPWPGGGTDQIHFNNNQGAPMDYWREAVSDGIYDDVIWALVEDHGNSLSLNSQRWKIQENTTGDGFIYISNDVGESIYLMVEPEITVAMWGD